MTHENFLEFFVKVHLTQDNKVHQKVFDPPNCLHKNVFFLQHQKLVNLQLHCKLFYYFYLLLKYKLGRCI